MWDCASGSPSIAFLAFPITERTRSESAITPAHFDLRQTNGTITQTSVAPIAYPIEKPCRPSSAKSEIKYSEAAPERTPSPARQRFLVDQRLLLASPDRVLLKGEPWSAVGRTPSPHSQVGDSGILTNPHDAQVQGAEEGEGVKADDSRRPVCRARLRIDSVAVGLVS